MSRPDWARPDRSDWAGLIVGAVLFLITCGLVLLVMAVR